MGYAEEITHKVSKPRVAFYTLGCKLNFFRNSNHFKGFLNQNVISMLLLTPQPRFMLSILVQ